MSNTQGPTPINDDGNKTFQQLLDEKTLALSHPQPITQPIPTLPIETNKHACQLAMLM